MGDIVLNDREIEQTANRVFYAIADQRLGEIIGMLQEIYCR